MDSKVLNRLHSEEQRILDEIVKICKNNNLTYFLTGGTLLGAIRHKGFIPWDDDLDITMPREDYERFKEIAESQLSDEFMLDCFKTNKKYYLNFSKIRLKNTIMDEKNLHNYKGNKGIFVDIFPLDYANEEDLRKLNKIKNREKFLYRLLIMKNLMLPKDSKNVFTKLLILLSKLVPRKLIVSCTNNTPPKNRDNSSKYFINLGSNYSIEKQTHLKSKYYPVVQVEFEGKMYDAPNDYVYVLTKIYGNNYMQLPPEEKRVTHNPQRIKFEGEEEIVFHE